MVDLARRVLLKGPMQMRVTLVLLLVVAQGLGQTAEARRLRGTAWIGRAAARIKAAFGRDSGAGLNNRKAAKRYIQSTEQLRRSWQKLSPEQRAKGLAACVNNQLKAIGVPGCEAKIKEISPTSGSFNLANWRINVDRRLVGKPTISRGKLKHVVSSFYHEGRHSEQVFRIARLLAGQGRDPIYIAHTMDIPFGVAKAAAKKPMSPSSPEAIATKKWYNSIFGKDAAKRQELLRARDAWVKAATSDKGNSTQALGAILAVTAYKGLPEEVDARRAERKATRAYKRIERKENLKRAGSYLRGLATGMLGKTRRSSAGAPASH